ncbi:LysR family transcriptional regulator [Phenylobacterium sp. LH3H17]|uniref:LysR family transcriptional regulator n=1 Tax=Phenylobacterium sp. LH3H17 TaxID=2903901 RepID=UPI0020C9A1BD|nr:LysR family transcriptional regulator [Phenylobacterium sp. LH3H17]UTP38217.1 LysR family transcriptional regulator [Phenylobacterium sp. LH3H17]
MELRELRYFLAVYETGSVTAAARRCFISQPSISAAMAALERELGAILFVRHRKGVTATAAAEALYVRARQVVDDALSLRTLFAPAPAAQVTLGLMPSLDISRVAPLLKPLTQAGDLRLFLVAADAPCDARIVARTLVEESEGFAPLWSEGYVLALPPRHPLRLKPKLSLADLDGLPLIARCNCENANQTSDLGFKPQIVAVAASEEWALALVEAGVGATVLPEGVVASNTRVVTRPLADLSLRREVGVAYRQADAGSPAVARILEAAGLGSSRRPAATARRAA